MEKENIVVTILMSKLGRMYTTIAQSQELSYVQKNEKLRKKLHEVRESLVDAMDILDEEETGAERPDKKKD